MQETILSVHVAGAIIGVASSIASILRTKTSYRNIMIASNGFAILSGAILTLSTNVNIMRSCALGIGLVALAAIGEARYRITSKAGVN